MGSIRPAELEDRLNASSDIDPFILDIRPEAAYASKAIEQSHNIPVYTELGRGEESALRDRLDEVPLDRDVIVVCKMGVVAKRGASVLNEEGYEASVLLGGMSGWEGYQNDSLGFKLRSFLWRLR